MEQIDRLAKEALKTMIDDLKNNQDEDGSWKFCFEGGPMTDAFLLMTLKSLNINDEELIKGSANRLRSLQTNNGSWKVYPNEESGNLTATVQAYSALLVSGKYNKSDLNMKKAELFIHENGGIGKTHFMTKWMLAANGLFPWPKLFYIPMSFLLIPPSFPINFFQLSTYARIHFIPMMIVANKKFSIKHEGSTKLDHLFLHPERNNTWELNHNDRFMVDIFTKEMQKLANLPAYIHRLGYNYAERYMTSRVEKDGTLYSYASSTFFMIYALLALGYEKTSPQILHAIKGLKTLITTCGETEHLENSTSTVWDTALISYSLQEAGVATSHSMIKKSIAYLLHKQHDKPGDWIVHNSLIPPGGWGFSNINSLNPDNDDTSAALRAITRFALTWNEVRESWLRGTNYLLSMQNQDGGWAAFEKNTDSYLLTYIPLENAKDAAIDPSTADLTGRVLEYLGNFAGFTRKHPSITAAVNWLFQNQQKDGSWFGRWGVCYLYGTWAAVTGLRAVGVPKSDPHIKKAVLWLKSNQGMNGGWGESCQSSEVKHYVPLPFSTPSQTAWAIDTLLSAGEKKDPSVTKGMLHLISHKWDKDSLSYPTGIGLPGQFYIHYHSYNKIFPLLAVGHYLKN